MKSLLCIAVVSALLFVLGCGKNGGFDKSLAVMRIDESGELKGVESGISHKDGIVKIGGGKFYFDEVISALKSEAAAGIIAEKLPPEMEKLILAKYGSGKSLARFLHESIIVVPDEASRTVAVGFAFPDKNLSVELANIFAMEFVAEFYDHRLNCMINAVEELGGKIRQTAAKLKDLDEKLLAFRSANGKALDEYESSACNDCKTVELAPADAEIIKAYNALKRERDAAEYLYNSFMKAAEIRIAQMRLVGPSVVIARGASL